MAGGEEVLVVGGGPAGLTVACELLRHGVGCRVIDRAPARAESSRATDIHSRTLELLADLGVADELIARGRRVRAFNAFAGARRVSRLELGALDSPYPFSVAVPQRDTEELLEDRLRELGGNLERGVELVGMEREPGNTGGVSATLRHVGGRLERTRHRWLVGCDGIRSAVRSAAGLPYAGVTYARRYLVADANLRWHLPHDEVHLFMSAEGFFNVVALPGDAARARVLCDLAADDPRPPTLALLQELMARRTHVPGRIEAPTFLSSFRIQCRMTPWYRAGPVLLAGDAAHTCSPLLGQGMNVGIQDGFNLGWKLALVCRHRASPRLLDSYEAERRPVAAAVLARTHAIHTMATLRGGWLGLARDLGSSLAARLGAVQEHAATVCSGLCVSYARSPIVRDGARERGTARRERPVPRAGERAPDVLIDPATRERLHGRLGGARHTLLVMAGSRGRAVHGERLAATASEVGRRFGEWIRPQVVLAPDSPRSDGIAGAVLRDPTGAVHARYAAWRGALFLVRPDGYIGYRAHAGDADDLVRYVERVIVG